MYFGFWFRIFVSFFLFCVCEFPVCVFVFVFKEGKKKKEHGLREVGRFWEEPREGKSIMRICAISFAIKKILKPAILKLLYRGMEKENLTETFSASLSLAALFMCSAVSSATSLLPLQQEGIVLSLLTRLAGWLSVTFLLTSQHQAFCLSSSSSLLPLSQSLSCQPGQKAL